MPTVWKAMDDEPPRQVECEVFAHPHNDAEGDTIYVNTHFATEAEAWEASEAEAAAHVSLAASGVKHARSALAKAEKEAADAAVHFATIRDARRRRDREGKSEAAEPCPGEGRCHGAMSWCATCGPVGDVCHDGTCDQHRRHVERLR